MQRQHGCMYCASLTCSFQVEQLRQHGYVIIDSFISRDLAEQVRQSGIQQHSKGAVHFTKTIDAVDGMSHMCCLRTVYDKHFSPFPPPQDA